MSEHGRQAQGVLLALLAYLIWGAFPLYWPLLAPAGAVEILAHRIVWSLVTLALAVTVMRRWSLVRQIATGRRLGLLAAAAVLISVNWGAYIWGVNAGRTVEAALGYFITPLITLLLGVVILGERLRALQQVAVAIAMGAVGVIAWDYGRLPWLALLLAICFGCYALLKKQANAPALEALTVESAVIAPAALAYLLVLSATGGSHFTSSGAGHTALLMLAGVITALPLLCFGAAATRMPMILLAQMQYLSPMLQFLVGVAIQHEHMTKARWTGFGIVWVALGVFALDAVLQARRGTAPRTVPRRA